MKKIILALLVLSIFVFYSFDKSQGAEKHTDANGYTYETVKEDPQKVRVYKLNNGLTVYLVRMEDAPRIQTFIAVRAGSTYDPKETTGLAHYLEHMMFKGNSRIGSLDWPKEKEILQQISDLYEQHKKTSDTLVKKKIYHHIDSLSLIAAKYCVASEYDKMVSSIGATGTNAWTSNEQTVYVNDVPSNELNKWLMLESTRFSELTLRLFHTELETVYEEFNMSQDRDNTRLLNKFMATLFPTHPYGTQTTIGKADHLKNPSMVNIHHYFKTYYVPNNMALCLSGDLDYDKTIKMIDTSFGSLKPNANLPAFNSPVEKLLDSVKVATVYGPDVERVILAFRFNGYKTKDRLMVTLLDRILGNGTAGLIDLDINQKQKAIDAGCWTDFMKYYGYHAFMGRAKEGQKLEEVKDLLLAEIEKIKKGDFEDWLVTAAVNDIALDHIKTRDNYKWLPNDFVEAFTNDISWEDYIRFDKDLEKITKKELVDFANEHYGNNNYVVAYKRGGKDDNIVKVNKPEISPIQLNREQNSDFFKEFSSVKTEKTAPVFVDFKKEISQSDLQKNLTFYSVKNKRNELFELTYIVDQGAYNNKLIPLAMRYLSYIGTRKYGPGKLKQELYVRGLSFEPKAMEYRCALSISGLNKSMEQGIQLMEQIINDSKPDTAIYQEFVRDILKQRDDAKKSKEIILNAAMLNYGIYGPKNPFNDLVPADSLYKIKPETLTNLIKNLFKFQHYFFYYGISEGDKVKKVLAKYHKADPNLKECIVKKVYEENEFAQNKVYFINYDMVQTNYIMVSKGQAFDPALIPYSQIFSEYFGSGLSSVVFQEIRESRALAYSAYAAYSAPSRPWNSFNIRAFVATQADKVPAANEAMTNLLNHMPHAEIQFKSSKESILKRIETERIIKSGIFWYYLRMKDLGIDHDSRMETYQKVGSMTMDDLEEFFYTHLNNKKYTYLIIGKKGDLNSADLDKMGEYRELTLKELFGY